MPINLEPIIINSLNEIYFCWHKYFPNAVKINVKFMLNVKGCEFNSGLYGELVLLVFIICVSFIF